MLSPDHSFVVPSISKDMRTLYDSHFAFVWRYMAHRGVALAAIDDLAQNVFRIVREHPSRRDPSRSHSVLVCMVSRQVLREYKKRQPAQSSNPMDDNDSPTMSFSRHAAGQVLDAVLEVMTETQREVLLLSQGESMSNHDIADALGVPEAVVQQRLEAAAKLMTTLVAKLRAHPIWDALPKSPRDARSLLEAAQKARTPTDADRERVFAGMLAHSMTSPPPANVQVSAPEVVSMPALSLPASVPTPEPLLMATPAAVVTQEFPMPKRPKKPLIWGAVAFAAVLFGIGGYAVNSMVYAGDWEQQTDESTGTAQAEAPAEPEATPEVAAAAPTPEPTVEAAPAPAEPEAAPSEPAQPIKVAKVTIKRRAAPRTREAKEPRAPKVDEARQLLAAERAYRAGETKLALDMLNDLERQYPESKLNSERNALRAQVLCGSGKTKAARRLILELEADQADKPLLAAVDKACTEQ